jgi:alkyl hydroperoxide reductase subunit AhpC
MRRLTLLVSACLLLLSLDTALSAQSAPATAAIGSVAPALQVRDLAGRPLDLSSYRGKVVLLDFWATWCVPCKVEIPHFIDMQAKYAAKGFVVIGISMDDTAAPVQKYVKDMKIAYPIALGNDALGDRYGGIAGLPTAFIIDREGRIRFKHEGVTGMDQFEKEILSLLGK